MKTKYYVMKRDTSNIFGYSFVREFTSKKSANAFAKSANGMTCVVFDATRYAEHRKQVDALHQAAQNASWACACEEYFPEE